MTLRDGQERPRSTLTAAPIRVVTVNTRICREVSALDVESGPRPPISSATVGTHGPRRVGEFMPPGHRAAIPDGHA
jgi:hypothetical protein